MAQTLTKTTTPKRNTSIARFAIKKHDPELAKIFAKDSALLPENKWIIKTSKELINEDPAFKSKIKKTTAWGLGIIGMVGLGITAALTAPLTIAIGVGAAAITGIAIGLEKIKSLAKDMKENHIPQMVDKFKLAILKDQVHSAKAAFQKRKDALLKTKKTNPRPPETPHTPQVAKTPKKEGDTFRQMKRDAAKWAFKKVAGFVKDQKAKKNNKPNTGGTTPNTPKV